MADLNNYIKKLFKLNASSTYGLFGNRVKLNNQFMNYILKINTNHNELLKPSNTSDEFDKIVYEYFLIQYMSNPILDFNLAMEEYVDILASNLLVSDVYKLISTYYTEYKLCCKFVHMFINENYNNSRGLKHNRSIALMIVNRCQSMMPNNKFNNILRIDTGQMLIKLNDFNISIAQLINERDNLKSHYDNKMSLLDDLLGIDIYKNKSIVSLDNYDIKKVFLGYCKKITIQRLNRAKETDEYHIKLKKCLEIINSNNEYISLLNNHNIMVYNLKDSNHDHKVIIISSVKSPSLYNNCRMLTLDELRILYNGLLMSNKNSGVIDLLYDLDIKY